MADRDEGARLEAVEDVGGFCFLGEFFRKGDDRFFIRFDCFSVGDLDAGSCAGRLDVDAVFFCGGVEVVAGGSSVDDGCVVCVVCCFRWDGSLI